METGFLATNTKRVRAEIMLKQGCRYFKLYEKLRGRPWSGHTRYGDLSGRRRPVLECDIGADEA